MLAPNVTRATVNIFKNRRIEQILLATPALILVGVFLCFPLMLMLRFSFNRFDRLTLMQATFTLENYQAIVTDPFFRNVLLSTLGMAGLTTMLCLVGGLPVGYFIARLRSRRLKTLLILTTLLPLLIGSAARTAGWMLLLGDRGIVNALLQFLHVRSMPIQILYTYTAVIIALVSVLLPFMVISLQSVIESIEPALEEASQSLGASPFRTFWRVTFPLAIPGVIAGCLFCFVLSMNAYATPRLIGGPQFSTMSTELYQQITQSSNWPMGSALAFVLMLVTSIAITVPALLVVARRHR